MIKYISLIIATCGLIPAIAQAGDSYNLRESRVIESSPSAHTYSVDKLTPALTAQIDYIFSCSGDANLTSASFTMGEQSIPSLGMNPDRSITQQSTPIRTNLDPKSKAIFSVDIDENSNVRCSLYIKNHYNYYRLDVVKSVIDSLKLELGEYQAIEDKITQGSELRIDWTYITNLPNEFDVIIAESKTAVEAAEEKLLTLYEKTESATSDEALADLFDQIEATDGEIADLNNRISRLKATKDAIAVIISRDIASCDDENTSANCLQGFDSTVTILKGKAAALKEDLKEIGMAMSFERMKYQAMSKETSRSSLDSILSSEVDNEKLDTLSQKHRGVSSIRIWKDQVQAQCNSGVIRMFMPIEDFLNAENDLCEGHITPLTPVQYCKIYVDGLQQNFGGRYDELDDVLSPSLKKQLSQTFKSMRFTPDDHYGCEDFSYRLLGSSSKIYRVQRMHDPRLFWYVPQNIVLQFQVHANDSLVSSRSYDFCGYNSIRMDGSLSDYMSYLMNRDDQRKFYSSCEVTNPFINRLDIELTAEIGIEYEIDFLRTTTYSYYYDQSERPARPDLTDDWYH